MTEYLYRYDTHNVSLGVDQFGDTIPGYSVSVQLHKFEIIKRTPKGAWIEYRNYDWLIGKDKKFVLLTARKQFASETVEKAKECFIARKRRYIAILYSKIDGAERAIEKVSRHDTNKIIYYIHVNQYKE